MEFRILGPVEVTAGSERLELGGARQQVVLAALLLGAGRAVSVGRLVEAVYGEDVPPTARSQVQISVSLLRRLFAARDGATAISTWGQGYLIEVGAGWLDSQRFEDRVAAARAARAAGRLEEAVAAYRDGLRLWRGPALDGIDSQLLRAAADRLDEQRVAANEDRLALELDLGRHHELVGELAELVGEFPLRERPCGQLMLALYRCGRTAEALAVYRQARRTMVEELGIEPGERLQELERAILTSDPALDLPTGPVRLQPAGPQAPGLLPADIADFTDRVEHTSQIHRFLVPVDGQEDSRAVPVVVVTGQGGVGKTSLAVHAAHGVAGCFDDGQLFADLHGATAHPVGPGRVLERFLRALGVPGGQVPEGLDERAEVYRNLLAGRRMLVVLDDAAGESQVAPLLPGSGAVLITSRDRLAGLAGATRVEVDVLDAGQSVDLLARVAGGRVQAQAAAAAAVAGRCGHLPLALRIAGARLAARPHWSVQQLADRLADETRRLDELRHGDLAVRASISLSYDGSTEQARRLLRRLALLEAPVFSGWVAAALLDQPPASAEDALDDLIGARLVETAGSGNGTGGQYRLHDLIRVFARERLAADEPSAEQTAALERALGALSYLADAARRRYYGGDYMRIPSDAPRWPLPRPLVQELVADPLAWYERERAALVAGVRQAARAGLTGLCWSLAFNAATLFEVRAYFDDWRETHDIALQATRQAGHVRGQAVMLYARGSLFLQQQRHELARRDLTAAAQLFQDAGDEQGWAQVTGQIAFLDRIGGRLDDATGRFEQALGIFRSTGDEVGAASTLRGLAMIKLDRGDLDGATDLLAEALRLARTAGSARTEAVVLDRIGEVSLRADEPTRAADTFAQALAKYRGLKDPGGEASALRGLGVAQTRLGEFGHARDTLRRALELADTSGDQLGRAHVLLGLGELALTSGDPGQAVVYGQQAANDCRTIGAPLWEARALTLLGDAHAALGDNAAADTVSARAAALRVAAIGDAPTV